MHSPAAAPSLRQGENIRRDERRNIDVVRCICTVLDALVLTDAPRESLIEFVTDQSAPDTTRAIDATKLENELNWRAQETFDAGIENPT